MIGCLAKTGFRQNNIDGNLTSLCAYYLKHYIFTSHVHINSNYIKILSITPYFTHSVEFYVTQFQTAKIKYFKLLVHEDVNYKGSTAMNSNFLPNSLAQPILVLLCYHIPQL